MSVGEVPGPSDAGVPMPIDESEVGVEVPVSAAPSGMADNLVEYFKPDELKELGAACWRRWDLASRQREDRMLRNKRWYELYGLVKKEKHWPFPNCANIVSPLLAGAVIHTHATLYDMLVPGQGQLYFSKPTTEDSYEIERANKTELVLNHVLRNDVPNYEIGFDDSLWQLVLFGSMFRRIIWGVNERRILADSISMSDFVVPYRCKVLDPNMIGVPSYTWVQYRDPEEIRDLIDQGFYMNGDDIDLAPDPMRKRTEVQEAADALAGVDPSGEGMDDEGDVQMFEQCCKVILPRSGDGEQLDGRFHYVTVTLDERTQTVLRITPREKRDVKTGAWREVSNFLHYKLFQSEAFYGMGFGDFVGDMNVAHDTILNQFIDALTLRNAGGGFVPLNTKSPKGEITIQPGVYQPLNIPGSAMKDAIYHHTFPDPNPKAIDVTESIKRMTDRVTVQGDLLSGDSGSDRKTATEVKTQVELIMKQLSVAMRRIKNSQKAEGLLLWYILSLKLDESDAMKVINPEGQPVVVSITRADFIPDANVEPVADPTITSRTQRIEHAVTLQQMLGNPQLALAFQNPQLQWAALERVLTAYGEYPMRRMLGPMPQQPKPSPPMDQADETYAMSMGKGMPIHLAEDDHAQHLADIEHHERTPAYHAMDPQSKALLHHHKAQHLAAHELQTRKKNERGLFQHRGAAPLRLVGGRGDEGGGPAAPGPEGGEVGGGGPPAPIGEAGQGGGGGG